jgi:hypothetical protein
MTERHAFRSLFEEFQMLPKNARVVLSPSDGTFDPPQLLKPDRETRSGRSLNFIKTMPLPSKAK